MQIVPSARWGRGAVGLGVLIRLVVSGPPTAEAASNSTDYKIVHTKPALAYAGSNLSLTATVTMVCPATFATCDNTRLTAYYIDPFGATRTV